MALESRLVPHPVLNANNYKEWEQEFNSDNAPAPVQEKVGKFAEAFQSEIVFTKADSPTPIAASYGAGPCVIMGAAVVGNVGFAAHFAHGGDVKTGYTKIVKFLERNLPKGEKPCLQLHLRGGIKGNRDSETTYRLIDSVVKRVNSLPLKFTCEIGSKEMLESDASPSQSLAIDVRNGQVSSYDPLVDNPDHYRELTPEDVLHAKASYEKGAPVKVIKAYQLDISQIPGSPI